MIAGRQQYHAGDIIFTRSGTTTTIKITLAQDFRFANVANNLKIEPLASPPTKFKSPGQFQYKFTCSQASNTCTTPPLVNQPYYGIHVDVERKVT